MLVKKLIYDVLIFSKGLKIGFIFVSVIISIVILFSSFYNILVLDNKYTEIDGTQMVVVILAVDVPLESEEAQ